MEIIKLIKYVIKMLIHIYVNYQIKKYIINMILMRKKYHNYKINNK